MLRGGDKKGAPGEGEAPSHGVHWATALVEHVLAPCTTVQ